MVKHGCAVRRSSTVFFAKIGRLFLGAAAGSCLLTLTASAGTETHTYDSLGRLKSTTFSDSSQIQYDYDPAGNRTSQVISGTGQQAAPSTTVVVVPLNGFTIIPINTRSVVTGN